MASLFDTLQANAFRAGIKARTRASRKWFSTNVKNLQVSRSALLRDTALKTTNVPVRGSMYMYFYDPKFKATLPYYDRFPLVFPFKRGFTRQRAIEGGSFLGLNLHYLHPRLRARLMDGLYTISTDKTFDEDTRIRISYNILNKASKFRFFKPCVKRYLLPRVRSRFVKINADQWDTALFLPTERFRKKSKSHVFRQSREIIGQ